MPIYATKEADAFLKELTSNRLARSLAASHFAILADNSNDKEWRKTACDRIKNAQSLTEKPSSHQSFVSQLIDQGAAVICAKLEARLILNAGDGVIENGGICLDRNSGVPYIPGSAIKAAARRWAIQQLSECSSIPESVEMLARIALVFGYGDTEWKAGRAPKKPTAAYGHSHSDFWLAMAPISEPGPELDERREQKWSEVSEQAAAILFKKLNRAPKHSDKPLRSQLPNLSGCINFLPAFPNNHAEIQTDVLTSHHPKYYDGKEKVATDDENPVPIFFPTVAKGTSYQFVMVENTLAHASDHLQVAKDWLSMALATLGLGAKTNAGYGWFSIDESAEKQLAAKLKEQQEKLAREQALASMSPEDQARETLSALNQEKFAETVTGIAEQSIEFQKVICEMLTNMKKEDWKRWRKSPKWQDRLPTIREIAASHGIQLN